MREYAFEPTSTAGTGLDEPLVPMSPPPLDPLCPENERPIKTPQYLAAVEQIATSIIEAANISPRPLLVGVNGVDTSGKTEFTRTLADLMQEEGFAHTVVHLDDFMNPKAKRHRGDNEIENYYAHAIDFGTVRDAILAPARSNAIPPRLTFKHSHPARDDYVLTHAYEFSASPSAILVEGVFLFRPELADFFDLKIYLDLPLSQVLARAALRDESWGGQAVLQKYREKYIPAQAWYLSLAQPAMLANFTIDVSDPANPILTNREPGARNC